MILLIVTSEGYALAEEIQEVASRQLSMMSKEGHNELHGSSMSHGKIRQSKERLRAANHERHATDRLLKCTRHKYL